MKTEERNGTLTPRQRIILGLVVQEFINTAEPVGSRYLVEHYDLKVSPATVRNEMKRLEELGYLTHPHTSAGRVPTHRGYRYFVQHLLHESSLPPTLQHTIRHQFYQIQQELDQWVRLSASVLARTVNSAAITTMPRLANAQFKHVELISLQPRTFLMVLVLVGGAVRQQLINVEAPWTQTELSSLSEDLNRRLAGMDWSQMRQLEPDPDPLARQMTDLITDVLYHEDRRSERIYRDGLTNVLQAPEFAQKGEARRFVEIFEEPSPIQPLIEETRQLPGVQVIIGGEKPYDHLPDISLVLSRYGQPSQGTGILGVVGPIRMPYGRTISAVRFMAHLMSSLVADLYGDALDAEIPDADTITPLERHTDD
ncbi:MAG: heat-inducible transcription repressor HrcA [Caldilineae bacterium]|nr:MAG: heat-inducible transcription repressor HrcA [Caldilineae bacterium]